MEPWHLWVIAALLLFIVEIFTTGFAVICIAAGALGGAAAAAFNAPFWGQILAFAILTLISLVTVRPLMLKYFSKGSKPSNMDSLIGRKAVLTEPAGRDTPGRIRLDGDEWQVVSADADTIPAGSWVEVVSRESNILTVKQI